MQNNMGMLMQAMRNPQAFMQQAMNNSQLMQNPISKNAIEMYQRGDVDGINQLADNLCKERGINRQDFEKQIMS
ncbi:MAG: hypothetical protein II304_13665, partial [Bacteroidales bacterium]|nr:hypothetical protein [Bacteroidales bacterium]